MKKFAVFSGFLGSGKTTTMTALTKYYTAHCGKAAMISNDLGKGVTLADHRLALLSGATASEITGECICYCHDVLTERLNAYYDDGCELVVSDIPGFGVGALEHVYHGLSSEYAGQYELAPFTVLVEPRTVELLRGGQGGDLAYILRTQLIEADLIVLNKCDLLRPAEIENAKGWLASQYPHSEVLAISAATGEGLDALSLALRQGAASMRHPDIGYGGAEFQNAMGRISEYYLQYRAQVCCNDFDGTEYLADIARAVQSELRSGDFDVPHLKLLAWEPEGDYGKVDLLGAERPVEITRRFARRCTDIAVVLNASAVCPAPRLDELVTQAVESISRSYQLELVIFTKTLVPLGE